MEFPVIMQAALLPQSEGQAMAPAELDAKALSDESSVEEAPPPLSFPEGGAMQEPCFARSDTSIHLVFTRRTTRVTSCETTAPRPLRGLDLSSCFSSSSAAFLVVRCLIDMEESTRLRLLSLLGGMALGMTMGPANAATPQYFNKKRGTAVGLAIAGTSLGGAVRICGFIILAILAPACIAIGARLPPRKSQFFLPSAFKEIPYLLLIAALFFLFIGMFTPIFFLPSYMSSRLAFYLIAILNAVSLPGRILLGILSDKIGRLNMLALAAISTGIIVLCWQRVQGNAGILVFTAFFGFTSGAIFSFGSVAFASVPKDPRNIGTYMGMGLGVASVAAVIGPPINGALVARYGGFTQVSILSGVFCLAGGS
ncbi:hypothetical protein VTN77DRAFT_9277 [Rasamsonia byssochlamydoides]|uniref:uncharacterized protein n=1 Tax=Rasamsonia byssochlamydoides TaxID=89139 RepID=UPI003741F092